MSGRSMDTTRLLSLAAFTGPVYAERPPNVLYAAHVIVEWTKRSFEDPTAPLTISGAIFSIAPVLFIVATA